MPRDKTKTQARQDDQGTMTAIIVQLKDNDETLQKGFDALKTAFASLGNGVRTTNGRGHVETITNNQGQLAAGDEEEETDEDSDYEAIDAPVASNGKPKQKTQLKFLKDMDFNAGSEPWKTFAARKNPTHDTEKYLVAAEWVSEVAGIKEFKVNHIFSCFRMMEWAQQKDFSQPMRHMKSKKSYFHNDKRNWSLTTVGLEAAQKIGLTPP